VLTILVYPYLLSKLWRYYPPIDVVAIEPDDEFNQKCIARARNEIHRLEAGLLEGKKEAFVKFAIPSDDGGADHLWGLAHSIIEGSVVVTLANEPVHDVNNSDHGDLREKVPLTEIQDWMLMDKNGNCEGGYTHLAMVNAYRKEHGKVPKKYLKDLRNFVDIQESEYA
jgi:uncharacterized protein YegJ (DUF2314 family)